LRFPFKPESEFSHLFEVFASISVGDPESGVILVEGKDSTMINQLHPKLMLIPNTEISIRKKTELSEDNPWQLGYLEIQNMPFSTA
jgi:hypothetical protein